MGKKIILMLFHNWTIRMGGQSVNLGDVTSRIENPYVHLSVHIPAEGWYILNVRVYEARGIVALTGDIRLKHWESRTEFPTLATFAPQYGWAEPEPP